MKMYYLILQMMECRLEGVPVTLGDTHMLPSHSVLELLGRADIQEPTLYLVHEASS